MSADADISFFVRLKDKVIAAPAAKRKVLADLYGYLMSTHCLKRDTLVLDNRNVRQGCIAAERIRKTVENHQFKSGKLQLQKVTVSIGVSGGLSDESKSSSFLLQEADQALYKAKTEGRNRVVCDSPTEVQVPGKQRGRGEARRIRHM